MRLAGRYDLRLMWSVKDVSGIPTVGKNLILVVAVDTRGSKWSLVTRLLGLPLDQVLHFRIFDGDGKMVVDTDEQRLTGQAGQIEDLREQLQSLWPPHELH